MKALLRGKQLLTPHLQKKLEECANVLRLEKDARLLYACNPVFEPKPEAQRLGTRLHIQVLIC